MTDILRTAEIVTHHVAGTPWNVRSCSRFAFDGGNRFLKWFRPDGCPVAIPSCIKKLESWEEAAYDDRSVLVEQAGEQYVIGEIAQQLGGTPTYQQSKAELANKLVLAAFEPVGEKTNILIDTLALTTPDTRAESAVRQLKRLQGFHQFTRNGVPITVRVNRVELVDECLSAWRYAWNHGMFRYQRANGIVDLGGGTSLARVILPSGVIDRSADVKLPGTFELANKIAAALKPQMQHSPDLVAIMDAIADGSFSYYGTPFAAIFEQSRAQWLEEIKGALRETWVKHRDSIGEVLIVGASAPLAQPLVDSNPKRFKIVTSPAPQFFSLYGMQEGV